MLTLGSLFDGMAGFPLAFAQAGVVTRWLVELEEDCRRVSGKHFPDAQAHVDVRDVGAHNLEPVDIITAGFPCQDLSVAGARAGLAGARSGLFFEIVRIVREMREATANEYPKYLVLENVPGLLSSHRGRDFAVVLGELADLGAVDIGWRVCDAQFWGVAQRRRRVFIVVCFGAERAAEILSLSEGGSGHPPARREAGESVAYCLAAGAGGSKFGSGRQGQDTFIPTVAHSLRAQGQLAHREDVDTLVPGWAAEVAPTLGTGWADRAPGSQNQDWVAQKGGLFVPDTIAFQQNQRDEVRDLGDRVGALSAQPGMKQQNYLASNMAVRRLTPLECLRLQGYPDDWFDGLNLSDSAKYRMCGNSVAVPVVAWLARRLAG